jgi:acetyltransferase-like isoleucine patch superfamily enzyme
MILQKYNQQDNPFRVGMIIPYDTNRSYVAISYDTATFNDLKTLFHLEGVELHRIDPDEFINSIPDTTALYINLVIKDMMHRKAVSEKLDQLHLDRFSFIHSASITSIVTENFGQGLFVYAYAAMQTASIVGNDIILFGWNGIGHRATIGNGCIFDAQSMTAGSAKIGNFCHLHSRAAIYDQVTVTDHVTIGANSVIRKDITKPGTYAVVFNQKLVKITDEKNS